MFEASRSFWFFDYVRVPYRLTGAGGSGPADRAGPAEQADAADHADHADHAAHPPGCAWVRAETSGRHLYWPPAVADGMEPGDRLVGSYRLGSIPIFGAVVPDTVALPFLSNGSAPWTPSQEVRDSAGTHVASIWTRPDGSVYLPFDPAETVQWLWSERYVQVERAESARTARAALLRAYYAARPAMPRSMQIGLRRAATRVMRRPGFPRWPLETGLHDLYHWLFALVTSLAGRPVPSLAPWPDGRSWAFVLTHDVETDVGVSNIEALRGAERELGYRSSWNFVPERYSVRDDLIQSLRADGCEVGVHGLRHDGRDLASEQLLRQRLPEMHRHAARWGAVGFRAPATQRGWDLMPLLGFDYDSSYPDTDPYEPIPGGCCSFLPFANQDLIELPITLPQDHTLFMILNRPDESVWVRKAQHIRDREGMVLALTHPDYATDPRVRSSYRRLLEAFHDDPSGWKALPSEVSAWWRARAASTLRPDGDGWRVEGPAAARATIHWTEQSVSPVMVQKRAKRADTSDVAPSSRRSNGARTRPSDRRTVRAPHVAIVVENIPFSVDHRARKQALSLLDRGFRVSVITRRDPGAAAHRARQGLRVIEYPAPPESGGLLGYTAEYGISFAAAVGLLLALHARDRVDLVQFCQPPDIYFPLGWLMRGLGSAVIVDQRDLMPELYAARYGPPGPGFARVLRRLERSSQRVAHHTLSVNEYLRDRAASAGAKREHISIVRNGPVLRDVEAVDPDAALKRGRAHLACWIGVMGRQDRLDLLLGAVHHLVFNLGRTDCQVAIVGDGECLAETKAAATSLGLEPYVDFTGWISEPEVFRYLATADVGLDASLQVEVSPVKAMEYMAFGLPFVAFDLQETRALGGEAASYAPAGDVAALGQALGDLLSDPERRASMGRAGRERVVSTLAWDRQAGCYLDVVEDLIARRRSRGRGRRFLPGRDATPPPGPPAGDPAARPPAPSTGARTR
jgi:glycosyltransferase involved in cell wall biosynthesis